MTPLRSGLPELVLQDSSHASWSDGPDASSAEIEDWWQPDGRMFARCGCHEGRYWIDLPDLARFDFDDRSDTVTATPYGTSPRHLLLDAYHRQALPLILQALGLEVLHASAVLSPRGVVGFCGDSQAGKSTLAYGFGRRGHQVWADDALALSDAPGGPRAVWLPFELRLRSPSASFFGFGATPDRLAVTVKECDPGPAPVAALCLLNRRETQEAIEVNPLGSVAAFPAMLAHAYCFSLRDDERKRRMVRRYLDVAVRVPILEVRFPSDLGRLDATLDAIERAVLAP